MARTWSRSPASVFPPHAASQTVSMCRNSLMRRFRICALKHVGRLWTKNPFRSPMPKAGGKIYHAPVFENGDSRKQLLSRSIYLLYKKESLWTESQRVRAGILFREYPDIKKAYYLSMRLGLIYHQCRYKDAALTHLARWYDEVEKSGFLAFGRVARSVQMHYREIINFFDRRSTNAASESFNAKIKEFRTQFRGVKDRAFFLFRLAKIYA